MFKYAELKYGKIVNLFEDFRNIENWREIHSPDKYWVDVTHIDDVKVGDVLDFKDGLGIVVVRPKEDTLENVKEFKLIEFKNLQYKENQAPVEYNYKFFDYDKQSKWKLLERIYQMELREYPIVLWKTADGEDVELTAYDLKGIIACGADRTDLLHIKYNQLKTMVENCQTFEELDNVEW